MVNNWMSLIAWGFGLSDAYAPENSFGEFKLSKQILRWPVDVVEQQLILF